MFISAASFIVAIDSSSSDVAEYLSRRFDPLWALLGDLQGESCSGYEHLDDDAHPDDPDVISAKSYEAGVKASIRLLQNALANIRNDARTLAEMREQEGSDDIAF